MIQVIANEIELHGLISDYSISVTPIESGHSFKSYNGTSVSAVSGYKTVIDFAMVKVPHATAQRIAEIVTAKDFDVTYTTPIEITGRFCCVKYEAAPRSSDPRQKNPLITDNITWDISMQISSEAAVSGSDGL